MKKFLLLSILAIATVFSAKAEYEFTLADLGSGWDSSYDAETKTITFDKAWTGRGWWFGEGETAGDLSNYEQVVVMVETSTIGAQIVIEYADGTKNSTGGADAGVTKLVCDLDSKGKSSVKQIYIQCKEAGTLTLVRAYCPDVLSYGDPITLEFNEWGQVESKAFNGYSDDAIITFTWTSEGTTGFTGWGAGSLKSLDGQVDTKFGFSVKEEGTNTFTCLLSDIKEALNSGPNDYDMYGIEWNMWNFDNDKCVNTRKSITIAEVEGFSGEGYQAPGTDSIDAIEAASEKTTIYNVLGLETEAKGLVIKNGNPVFVK